MSCILGIDFGLKRIGVALGYVEEKMSLPLTVLPNNDVIFKAIHELIKENDAQLLVIGLPKTLKNKEEEMAELTRDFARRCQQCCHCKIEFVDERLSSKQASQQLSRIGISHKKQRGKVDAHAAAVILESYLNESKGKEGIAG